MSNQPEDPAAQRRICVYCDDDLSNDAYCRMCDRMTVVRLSHLDKDGDPR